MKKSFRVLSMLLAFALLVGLLPTLPLLANAAVADTPEGVRNHLPVTATDIKYLSDMTWEFSQNEDGTYQTIKDGAFTRNNPPIVLGNAENKGGTTFEKGLGVMPANNPDRDAEVTSQTIFDLSDNNYAHDYFYSAVGITNRNADKVTHGVIFEVWASYDKTEENYANAEYVLLEQSDVITAGNVYHFHLNVSGVRYLKLVVYPNVKYDCMNSAWAGACLYNNEGYYPKTAMIGNGSGAYVAPASPNMFNTYQYQNLPADTILLAKQSYHSLATESNIFRNNAQEWAGGTHTDGTNQKDGLLLEAGESLFFGARPASESDGRADG